MAVTVERKGHGLALLSSLDDLGEGRELSASDPAKADLVTVLSNSERLGAWAWTQGLVSDAQDGLFQTDAVVDAGQAGGAVLDENGRLAGLLTLRDAEAEDGEGQWPVGIPASKVKAWIEGNELQDAGTSSIIQASYIYSNTQWGSVRGKCVANCGGGSSNSRGYSSNPGAEALGRAMGEAIGQGVRALFKGLGSMFRSKGQGFAKKTPKPRSSTAAKTEKPKPVEAPKPPPPSPSFISPSSRSREASAPTRRGCSPRGSPPIARTRNWTAFRSPSRRRTPPATPKNRKPGPTPRAWRSCRFTCRPAWRRSARGWRRYPKGHATSFSARTPNEPSKPSPPGRFPRLRGEDHSGLLAEYRKKRVEEIVRAGARI